MLDWLRKLAGSAPHEQPTPVDEVCWQCGGWSEDPESCRCGPPAPEPEKELFGVAAAIESVRNPPLRDQLAFAQDIQRALQQVHRDQKGGSDE